MRRWELHLCKLIRLWRSDRGPSESRGILPFRSGRRERMKLGKRDSPFSPPLCSISIDNLYASGVRVYARCLGVSFWVCLSFFSFFCLREEWLWMVVEGGVSLRLGLFLFGLRRRGGPCSSFRPNNNIVFLGWFRSPPPFFPFSSFLASVLFLWRARKRKEKEGG